MLDIVVFIVDTGKVCYAWVGSGASEAERKNAMSYASVSVHIQPTHHGSGK